MGTINMEWEENRPSDSFRMSTGMCWGCLLGGVKNISCASSDVY